MEFILSKLRIFLSIMQNSPFKTRAFLAISGFAIQILHKLGFDTGLTPNLQQDIISMLDSAMILLLMIPGSKKPNDEIPNTDTK